jgi:hypothetical protein
MTRARNFTSEKAFQREVVKLAEEAGWMVCHVFRGKTAKGEWRTNTTAPGYPDLTMVRPGRLVFLELKMPGNTPSPAQQEWVSMLQTVATASDQVVEAYVVWPADWPAIVEVLTR